MNNKFFYDESNDVNNMNNMNNMNTPNNQVPPIAPNTVNTPVVPSTPNTFNTMNNATVITPPHGGNKQKPIVLIVVIIAAILVVGVGVILLLTQSKKGTTYYCEEGYKLVGDICSITVTERPIYDLGCPEGYEYSGLSHKCEKQVEEEPYFRLDCPEGFILNNENKCEGDKPMTATEEYVCTNGELVNRTCVVKSKNNKVLICNPYCPEGLTSSEDKKVCFKETNPDPVKGCPNTKGWQTLSNGKCYYTEQPTCDYSCPKGYTLENNSCFSIETKEADLIYTCPEGTILMGRRCNTPTIKEPKTVKYCDEGAELNKKKTYCLKTIYKDIGDVATCQKGYTLEGNTCTKIETKAAMKK